MINKLFIVDLFVLFIYLFKVGSFVIRDSTSHSNCYALSVQTGESAFAKQSNNPHAKSGAPMCGRDILTNGLNKPFYSALSAGISHFLIQRTANGGVKLKVCVFVKSACKFFFIISDRFFDIYYFI